MNSVAIVARERMNPYPSQSQLDFGNITTLNKVYCLQLWSVNHSRQGCSIPLLGTEGDKTVVWSISYEPKWYKTKRNMPSHTTVIFVSMPILSACRVAWVLSLSEDALTSFDC
jgi:hypothetical protein